MDTTGVTDMPNRSAAQQQAARPADAPVSLAAPSPRLEPFAHNLPNRSLEPFRRRSRRHLPLFSARQAITAGLALTLALAGCGCAGQAARGSNGSATAQGSQQQADATGTVELTASYERVEPTVDANALDRNAAAAADFAVRLFQASLGLQPVAATAESDGGTADAQAANDGAASSSDDQSAAPAAGDQDSAPESAAPAAGDASTAQAAPSAAADPAMLPAVGNTLVSPLSLTRALGLLAPGAAGDTLSQLENALGMDRDELIAYVVAYGRTLDINPQTLAAKGNTWIDSPLAEPAPDEEEDTAGSSDKGSGDDAAPDQPALNLAESLWLRDNPALNVRKTYLQTVVDNFDAQLFQGAFDAGTVADLNSWVAGKTKDRITQLISEFSPHAQVCLVNALAFDGSWETPYEDDQVEDHTFTKEDGTQQPMRLMRSTENRYLEVDGATGFVKPYAGGRYAFVALLPAEGSNVAALAQGLTGAKLRDAVANAETCEVRAGIPRFSLSYEASLAGALQALGVTDLFDPATADLSDLAVLENEDGSSAGNLAVSDVLQKTYIKVDEKGTEAAAATAIIASAASAPAPAEEPREVLLDRPFVYAVYDTQTQLPVFLGTVTDMQGLDAS